MRFSSVVLAYVVIGSMMWAGGAIGWADVGMASVISQNDDGNIQGNESTGKQLENSRGPLEEAVASLGGGALLAVFSLISTLLGLVFWPITTLSSVGAPIHVTVLLGGSLSAAFFASFIMLIRGV